MVDIQFPTLRMGEEKKEEEDEKKKEVTTAGKYNGLSYYTGRP